jgi:hypothetical protein
MFIYPIIFILVIIVCRFLGFNYPFSVILAILAALIKKYISLKPKSTKKLKDQIINGLELNYKDGKELFVEAIKDRKNLIANVNEFKKGVKNKWDLYAFFAVKTIKFLTCFIMICLLCYVVNVTLLKAFSSYSSPYATKKFWGQFKIIYSNMMLFTNPMFWLYSGVLISATMAESIFRWKYKYENKLLLMNKLILLFTCVNRFMHYLIIGLILSVVCIASLYHSACSLWGKSLYRYNMISLLFLTLVLIIALYKTIKWCKLAQKYPNNFLHMKIVSTPSAIAYFLQAGIYSLVLFGPFLIIGIFVVPAMLFVLFAFTEATISWITNPVTQGGSFAPAIYISIVIFLLYPLSVVFEMYRVKKAMYYELIKSLDHIDYYFSDIYGFTAMAISVRTKSIAVVDMATSDRLKKVKDIKAVVFSTDQLSDISVVGSNGKPCNIK